jgi:hypothetical protein
MAYSQGMSDICGGFADLLRSGLHDGHANPEALLAPAVKWRTISNFEPHHKYESENAYATATHSPNECECFYAVSAPTTLPNPRMPTACGTERP